MLLLAVGWLVTAQAFFSPSAPIRVSGYPPTKSTLTSKTRDTHATGNFNSYTLGCMRGSGSSSEQAAATDTGVSLLASNDNSSSFIDATFLAERIPLESTTPASNYQITRPRWYNKNEAGIIVLLVQRLRLLDVRGVEHMLEAVDAYREVDTVSPAAVGIECWVVVCSLRRILDHTLSGRSLLVVVEKALHVMTGYREIQ